MASPVIQLGNLSVIPVLRSRLAFAVLFRNALLKLSEAMEWNGREDLICVTLPASLKATLAAAVSQLPRVSQIWAEASRQSGREVFSVSPCDAFTEAVRTGAELGTPVEFVDLEVMPGNLVRLPCERNPEWPDDGLIELIGIEKYLQFVSPHLVRPPMRFEPVDTWREAHITQRIRELYPCWRRILLLCDMSIVSVILAALENRDWNRTVAPKMGQPARVRLQTNLNLQVQLNNLDDFPRLVQRYEESRRDPALVFEMKETLLSEIAEFLRTTTDVTISTRQVEKFSVLLNNHLVFGRRRVPDAQTVFACALGCFGRAVAERLHCHLASYFTQISVERVRPRHAKETVQFRYTLDTLSNEKGYETRECNPTPPRYEILPQPEAPKNEGVKSSSYEWPPEEVFLKSVQAKIVGLTQNVEAQRNSHPFSGSIEAGIDTRRTLRSLSAKIPRLYVKGYQRLAPVEDLEKEPVLWILSDEFATDEFSFISDNFDLSDRTPMAGRQPGKSFFVSSHDVWNHRGRTATPIYTDEKTNIDIYGVRRLARITFGDQYQTEAAARTAYGEAFERRIPNHKEYEHPDDRGCVRPELVEMLNEGASWLEIAALTAAKYAESTVTVLAPAGFQFPPSIVNHPLCRGIRFNFLSLEAFSREERDKMRMHYQLSARSSDLDGHWRQFYALMVRFWT